MACNDGSEVHASELEEQTARARAAEAAMVGLESMREVASALYLKETGSSWRPAGGSRLSHSARLTSAVVDGRESLRARAERRRTAAMPQGTPVVSAGGRLPFPPEVEAKAFASNLWNTLDRVRDNVADLVLVHGGDSEGVDRLATSWAEQRKVPQVAFSLDRRLGQRAGFRRNEQMLSLKPRYGIAFAGSDVVQRLVIQAQAAARRGRRSPWAARDQSEACGAGWGGSLTAPITISVGSVGNGSFRPARVTAHAGLGAGAVARTGKYRKFVEYVELAALAAVGPTPNRSKYGSRLVAHSTCVRPIRSQPRNGASLAVGMHG